MRYIEEIGVQDVSMIYDFSHKADGNMSFKYGTKEEVTLNRRRFLSQYGLELEDVVTMAPEHSDTIVVVSRENRGQAITADALITRDKNVVLFLATADCLPVVYWDPVSEVIAIVHLGWRPTHLRLASKVVSVMQKEFESIPRHLEMRIGPGIHKESYKTTNPSQQDDPAWAPFLKALPDGQTSVDLTGFNLLEFFKMGVSFGNIWIDPHDTAIMQTQFSHYRSRKTGEPEGRFATIVTLKDLVR